MNLIIRYDIEHYGSDTYLQTHSTNPLLRRQTVDSAIEAYANAIQHGYDSLFSVTKYQTRLYDSKGNAVNHNPRELLRTQDLPVLFEENSCLYIFSRDSFSRNGYNRIGARPFMFEIPKTEAIDIDTNEDFLLCEAMYKMKQQ
jgi:CMP-N-acetylneuraminic acid synthetase